AVAVCFSFSVFASPRDLLSFPTRRSSDLQRHIGGIIRKRGVVDQPPLLADPVHDVVAGVDAERAGDAFELLAVPYVDAHGTDGRSEEHTSELQSRENLVCRLLLEKKNKRV